MRLLVSKRMSRSSRQFFVGVVAVLCAVVEITYCSDLRGNVSEVDASSANATSGRQSRQLWSLVKNVIKTGLEQSGGVANGGSGGGLGTLAGLVGSALVNGVNSGGGIVGGNQYYQQSQQGSYQYPQQNLGPGHFSNPNEYMHYLLANSQSNQHSSLPHYLKQQKEQQDSAQDLIDKYKEQMMSGTTNVETQNAGSQILNKLAFGSVLDNLDSVSNILSFTRFEGMMEKINKFDKLKCIPRLLCQMVSKRVEDQKKEEEKQKAKQREDSSTTTKRPMNRKVDDEEEDKKARKEEEEDATKLDEPESKEEDATKLDEPESKEEDATKLDEPESKEERKQESDEETEDEEEDDDEEDDSDEAKEYVVIKKGAEDKKEDGVKRKGRREGRFLKLNGSDTALEQFVKFLELMQLKDWSIYPYVNGAYQGHQVSRTEECAYRFPTCPFSDEQLVYYFNNYNGGFFQSI